MCYVAAEPVRKRKPSSQRWLQAQNRALDIRNNGMGAALQLWMMRFARAKLKEVNGRLDSGGISGLARSSIVKSRFEKAAPRDFGRMEQQLLELLRAYGFAQMNEGGRQASRSVGGRWHMTPQVRADMNQQLENKVVLLIEETEVGVRESVKQLVTDALLETPRPSARELGRRIARQWMGPPKIRRPAREGLRGSLDELRVTADWRRTQEELDAGGREHLFSFARAQTIARTELAQATNAGQAQGYADAGVEEVRWLAFKFDGRSGKRKHYQMNAHPPITVEAMRGKDSSKWFKLPSGIRTPHPNWIGLPAGETVNCRCNTVPN